jgi:superfamily II DNA helicase RecQ
LQEEFIQQNKLVRPRVVRELINRSNIKYTVSRQTGPGTLIQKAATLAKICWQREEVFNSSQDKIIIYCQTREAASELG